MLSGPFSRHFSSEPAISASPVPPGLAASTYSVKGKKKGFFLFFVSSASRVWGQHILCKGKEKRETRSLLPISLLSLLTSCRMCSLKNVFSIECVLRRRTNSVKGQKTEEDTLELCVKKRACRQSHGTQRASGRTKNGNFQNLWRGYFSEFMKRRACRQSHGTPKSVWPCSHPCCISISNTSATH